MFIKLSQFICVKWDLGQLLRNGNSLGPKMFSQNPITNEDENQLYWSLVNSIRGVVMQNRRRLLTQSSIINTYQNIKESYGWSSLDLLQKASVNLSFLLTYITADNELLWSTRTKWNGGVRQGMSNQILLSICNLYRKDEQIETAFLLS